MATLFITEFTNSGADSRGSPVQAAEQPPVAEQAITTTGTSAQSAVLNASTTLVRLHTDTTVFVLFGIDPTATAAKMRLAADSTEYFVVRRGCGLKIAGIN